MEPQAAIAALPPVRVLLVEDDGELREALVENLRLNGMEVVAVGTGAAFRQALRLAPVEAAVIDVNLPDASGFDLAAALAEEPDRPGIVILTARAGRDDRLHGYAGGADIYMTKPVDNEELVLAVRNLARRVVGARRERPATTAAWRLDVGRRVLTAPDGTVLVLSGREAMLLELFHKANGAPLPRAFVAATMGYGPPGPQHRGLDAALRRLRDKAAQRRIELPILSVQAIGLRFAAPLALG